MAAVSPLMELAALLVHFILAVQDVEQSILAQSEIVVF
jgi:hypothetical protein